MWMARCVCGNTGKLHGCTGYQSSGTNLLFEGSRAQQLALVNQLLLMCTLEMCSRDILHAMESR
jgi:hypothetical protein